MRTAAVITIAAAHDARNAAYLPTVPVPDRSCQARIPVRGRRQLTPALLGVGVSCRPLAHPPSQRSGRPLTTRSPRTLRRTPRTKGRHHARTSRTPPGSGSCHHPAAPIPQRHRPAEAIGPADTIGGHDGAHPAACGRRVPRGDVAAAQDHAPSPPPCVVPAREPAVHGHHGMPGATRPVPRARDRKRRDPSRGSRCQPPAYLPDRPWRLRHRRAQRRT